MNAMPVKIGVIGGGAAGLAILKILSDTDEVKNGDWLITAFEKRDDIGGIWYDKYYILSVDNIYLCRYPSPPVGNPPATPLYTALTTNIPHISMAFHSFLFEPSTPLFPSAEVVLKYLHDYARHFDIRKFIQFQSTVEACKWDKELQAWVVHVKASEPSISQTAVIHKFDKLIIANGHYSNPRYPLVPGLSNWLKPLSSQMKPRASHAVYFRNPAPYKDKRVLVVGGGPSGRDITIEVCKVASMVYHSSTDAIPSSTTIGNCILVTRGRVKAFHENGLVSFIDEKEDEPSMELDHAILATGYEMYFPFMKSPVLEKGNLSSDSDTIPPLLVNTTYSVYPLTRHVLPITTPADEGLPWDADPSSLAFIGLPIRVAPFPLLEIQARYLVSLYRNPNIFSFSREQCWIEDRYKRLKEQFDTHKLIAKNLHVFAKGSEQYTYAEELLRLSGLPEDCELYPEPWALEIYEAKDILRKIWRMLESEGKAEEIVRGVGSAPGRAGRKEWAEFARMLMREYGSKV